MRTSPLAERGSSREGGACLDRQEQLELLLEHYNYPCCREKLPDAEVAMPGGNPGCGDKVTVYLKVARPDADGGAERIERATFLGSGCTISQAAASILMEMMQERRPTLDEVLAIDYEALIDTLGREVVAVRPRCATLALGTLKAAIRKHRRDEQRRAAGLSVEAVPEEELERFEL